MAYKYVRFFYLCPEAHLFDLLVTRTLNLKVETEECLATRDYIIRHTNIFLKDM